MSLISSTSDLINLISIDQLPELCQLHYISPAISYNKQYNNNDNEASYLIRLQQIIYTTHQLLQLSTQEFWSYTLSHQFHIFINEYIIQLQLQLIHNIQHTHGNIPHSSLHNIINHNVCKLLLRIYSSDVFQTAELHQQLLHQCQLLNSSLVMSICTVYNKQSDLMDRLQNVVGLEGDTFRQSIQSQLLQCINNSLPQLIKLSQQNSIDTQLLNELCYLLCIVRSTAEFFAGDTIDTLMSIDFMASLVVLYEQSIPILINDKHVKHRVQFICIHIISSIINKVLQYIGVVWDINKSTILLTPTASDELQELLIDTYVESFNTVITSLVTVQTITSINTQHRSTVQLHTLVRHVSRYMKLDKLLEQMKSKQYDTAIFRRTLDITRIDYLTSIIQQSMSKSTLKQSVNKSMKSSKKHNSNNISLQNIDQQILELTELFRDMSIDYARACIKHYNGDLQLTIQAILDNNLPAILAGAIDSNKSIQSDSGKTSSRVLHDDDDQDSKFNEYLARTGRIAKTDVQPTNKTLLNSFSDNNEGELIKTKLQQQLHAQFGDMTYDDELDDGFDDYVLMPSIDTANFEVNDNAGAKQNNKSYKQNSGKQILNSSDTSESDDVDVRDKWRKQSQLNDQQQRQQQLNTILHIAPSRRTSEQQAYMDSNGDNIDTVAYPTKPKSNKHNHNDTQTNALQRGNKSHRGTVHAKQQPINNAPYNPKHNTENSTSTSFQSNSTPATSTAPPVQSRSDITDAQQRRYKDTNKARFGNHNRKKGADAKMSRGMGGLPG